MEMSNEVKEVVYKYDLDLTEEEKKTILSYAMSSITQEELDAVMIDWAVVDMLTRHVEEEMKKIT